MAMNADQSSASLRPRSFRHQLVTRFLRLAIVLAGIVLGQAVLYGPSLLGKKILLPLDLLASPGVYLPQTPEVEKIMPRDPELVDLVLQFEPERRFTTSEIKAGRFPMWAPYQYTGSPLVWPKFSPFILMECSTASPVILAWVQLVEAIVAGLGAFLFFRRAIAVGFWAATIPAWCYPLTGFFVFWQGFPTCGAIYWFPWLLLAVNEVMRRPGLLATMELSLATWLTLVSGHVDVAGQALVASGGYALWCLADAHHRQWFPAGARKAIGAAVAGWLLGFMLAAPHLLPLLEYAHTGARMVERAAGKEERPPTGWLALPQIVLPDMYGRTQTGSLRIVEGNQTESSAAGYAGVLTTLFVAPLAWCSRRRRSFNLFCVLVTFLALSWCLNVPGLVAVLRLPGLRMMSHNRLVFVASFAILALAAAGLETLWQGRVQRRRWFWLPTLLLAGMAGWCFYRTIFLPEPIATEIGRQISRGNPAGWVQDSGGVQQVQAWYVQSYLVAGMGCTVGIAAWLLLWFRQTWPRGAVPVLALFLLGDLLWFAHGRSAQCDPALYYPRIPVLEEIAKASPGRVIGCGCLPATLAQTHGLCDVRGYDSIDPAPLVELTASAAAADSPSLEYALMEWFVPRVDVFPPDGIRLSPILDMLNVRYVIFRGTPSPEIHPAFLGADYYALINRNALPRVFVPQHIEAVSEEQELLKKLASPLFNPRDAAYVGLPVALPDSCRGTAAIVEEVPTRILVSIQMETAGMVVLADLWDEGWRAYLNGRRVPVLRVNHAIRGVVVPPGTATLEFRYRPASLIWGLCLAGLAGVLLIGGLGIGSWHRLRAD